MTLDTRNCKTFYRHATNRFRSFCYNDSTSFYSYFGMFDMINISKTSILEILKKKSIVLLATACVISSCFTFDAPVDAPIEADFDVQECQLMRSLNEGEDPWYHCRDEVPPVELPYPRQEGELCCLGSDCETSLCICGICMVSEGFF